MALKGYLLPKSACVRNKNQTKSKKYCSVPFCSVVLKKMLFTMLCSMFFISQTFAETFAVNSTFPACCMNRKYCLSLFGKLKIESKKLCKNELL